MKKIISFLAVLSAVSIPAYSQPRSAEVIEFICANKIVDLRIHNGDISDQSRRKYSVESMVEVAWAHGASGAQVTFRVGGDRLGGLCTSDAEGRPRIVFSAQCGRSGCDIEPSWGVLDAETGRVLLAPEAGNSGLAKTMLGSDLPAIRQTISISGTTQD